MQQLFLSQLMFFDKQMTICKNNEILIIILIKIKIYLIIFYVNTIYERVYRNKNKNLYF